MFVTFENRAMPQKIIIDADPGIGDALAIAIALLDPEFDVVALTAVGGNVSEVQASRNLQSVIEALDPPKWPRIGVADAGQRMHDAEADFIESLAWEQSQRSLNGPDGLGDWVPNAADLHHPKDSAKLLTELVRQYPNEIVLLTLGPLTNLALACDRDAEFFSRVQGVVSLAGAVTAPGDITATAEFNVLHHPEAAQLVLKYPATKTLVPLDVSQRAMLTFEQFQRFNLTDDTRCGHLLRQLIPFALRAHHQHLGVEGMWLPGVTALASIRHPRLFQQATMAIDVELQGRLTCGMTVFDRRAKTDWRDNIDVLLEVEPQGVLDYFTSVVQRSVM
jgi:inosine-uridine nucleoside N-ribohydrolase